ncbi:putative uncharacterized protein [Bacteroides sp. CAG:598]|nr:putative uncharacterized protein [Bacteroides sp. CAG:598]
MKIVYCIHGTFNSGGMERIIISKANYLAKKGFKVFIITTEQKERTSFFYIYPSIECLNLDINYGDENNSSFIRKIISFRRKQRVHKEKLRNILYKIKADIVISTFGNEVNFLYSIKDGSKKLLEIHFSKFFRNQQKRKGIWKIVDKYRSYIDENKTKKYDKFIVLTYEDRFFWKNQNNIIVIPNFIPFIPEAKAKLTNKICLAVGRLTYQKGFDRLIDIWKLVYEKFPDWQLHIYGSGELHDSLQNKINNYHLENVVKIYSPTKKIDAVYKESSILLLTSHYEGLPMVLLEAFSYGLPVVSFACKCGPKDLIENGINGYLLSDGDIANFAGNVIRLISDENLRQQMGNNAYLSVHQYSEKRIMDEWINLFHNI